MRRVRVLLGSAVLVLALLVGCAWLLPGMLDGSRFRTGIEALASEQLGRPVHIGGAIGLQILPQPILTASDIVVDAGVDAGAEAGMDARVSLQARALRLRVGLGALLAGRLDARELTLQGADLLLPWPPPQGALSQRPPSWLTALQAKVEDSRLRVGAVVFSGIDAMLTTDPDTGTLSAAGTGRSGARLWQFTARLARPGRDGSAGLDVSLDGQEALRDTGGTFSGQLGRDGALSGRVAGRGPDLSLLMPAPAVAWRADGRLTAAGGLAVADELALEIGGAPARGAVALRVEPQARLDVAITAGRLDLDGWLPALLGRKPGSLRAGIPTGIDLSAEAATLAGGTLRQLRGGVDLGGSGGVALREVSAVLPGEAALSLSGQVSAEGGGPARFEGPVRLQAPDLRGTLRWLERGLAGALPIPPGVLRTAELTGRVTAELSPGGQVGVSGVQGTLDGSTLGGEASFRLGGRPSVTATLTLDRLLLDPWLPDAVTVPSAEAVQAALAALRSADVEVKLQAGRARWAGVALGALALELQTEASRVVLRRLDLQPFGARASLSAQVGESGRLSDGRLEVVAPALERLRPVLDRLPGWMAGTAPLLQGPGSLLVLAAGAPDALAGRVTLEMGDLRLEAQPTVSVPARRWAGPLTVHHPGAPRLLELLGGGAPVGGPVGDWLGDGSFSLLGNVTATPGRVALEGGSVSAGGLRGTVGGWAEGRRVAGQVALESLPLPAVDPRSTEPLRLDWLRSWRGAVRIEAGQVLVGLAPVLSGLATDATLEDGTLRLDKLGGRLEGGGSVSGAAVLAGQADPPRLSVQGQLAGAAVPGPVFGTAVDLVGGQADVSLDVSAEGHSPATLLATLGGQATVRVQGGTVAGFDLAALGTAVAGSDPLAALEAARLAILAGQTAFETLALPLTVQRGVVTVDGHLSAVPGEVAVSGTVDLQGGGQNLHLTLRPAIPGGGSAPSLGLRLTGGAGGTARTPELAGLARWLADRPGP